MPHLDGVAPVFPVRDLVAALDHYRQLGFEVHAHDDSYGFATADGVQFHFAHVDDVDPATSNSAAYLHVDDADALYEQWNDTGVGGRFHAPTDTDYGLREGAHVDPDGNLIRFGSPSPEGARDM